MWPLWERLAHRFAPTIPIPDAPYNVVHIHIGPFRGRPIDLPDGVTVRPGDSVAEFHLDNSRLLHYTQQTGWDAEKPSRWRIIEVFAGDLSALATWILQPDFPPAVRAFFGISIIGPGPARMGFTTRNRPLTWRTRLDQFFADGLLALYTPEGLERLQRGLTGRAAPQEVWMSRRELVRLYGPEGEWTKRRAHSRRA